MTVEDFRRLDEEEKKREEEGVRPITGDEQVLKQVLRPGQGRERPRKNSSVLVHFVLKLEDGTLLYTTRDGDPLSLPHLEGASGKEITKGLQVALRFMRKSEVSQIIVYPEYGYDKEGETSLGVPPNATLIYEVELISFINKLEVGEEIQKWLLCEGEGWDIPNFDTLCTVHIHCLNTEETVTFYNTNQAEPLQLRLGVDGIEEGLTKGLSKSLGMMKKGEICKCVISERLGYGKEGNKTYGIPPNVGLVYIIHLISFTKRLQKWDLSETEKLEMAQTLKAEGNLLYNQKRYDAARRKYKYSLQYVKEMGEEARQLKNTTKGNLSAVYLCIGGKDDHVISNLTEVLNEGGASEKVYYRRGMAYLNKKMWDEARKDFISAQLLAPTSSDVLQALNKLDRLTAREEKEELLLWKQTFQKMDEENKFLSNLSSQAVSKVQEVDCSTSSSNSNCSSSSDDGADTSPTRTVQDEEHDSDDGSGVGIPKKELKSLKSQKKHFSVNKKNASVNAQDGIGCVFFFFFPLRPCQFQVVGRRRGNRKRFYTKNCSLFPNPQEN
eukprot:TRINITY_DN3512_c0_g1_i5.p1 TRINITY_DN3512_c0_g1~~TRINITY_DN3512_c0_g1_i5.p1  ORF type:complete len:591 (-),score=146.57 TRINITY_DN3512_c0_g1_i5:546-2204(-)